MSKTAGSSHSHDQGNCILSAVQEEEGKGPGAKEPQFPIAPNPHSPWPGGLWSPMTVWIPNLSLSLDQGYKEDPRNKCRLEP